MKNINNLNLNNTKLNTVSQISCTCCCFCMKQKLNIGCTANFSEFF